MNKYNWLRKLPNEIIVAAFNRVSDDYLDLDNLDEESLEYFDILVSPNFNEEQEQRRLDIEQEYKEKAYEVFKTLKEGFVADHKKLEELRELKSDYDIEIEVLGEYQQEHRDFLHALTYFVDALAYDGQKINSCGNFHVDKDDAEMIITKGLVKIIQDLENGEKNEFVLYDESEHKALVDAMIKNLSKPTKERKPLQEALSENE